MQNKDAIHCWLYKNIKTWSTNNTSENMKRNGIRAKLYKHLKYKNTMQWCTQDEIKQRISKKFKESLWVCVCVWPVVSCMFLLIYVNFEWMKRSQNHSATVLHIHHPSDHEHTLGDHGTRVCFCCNSRECVWDTTAMKRRRVGRGYSRPRPMSAQGAGIN